MSYIKHMPLEASLYKGSIFGRHSSKPESELKCIMRVYKSLDQPDRSILSYTEAHSPLETTTITRSIPGK